MTDADAQIADVFVLHGWPEANDLVHRQLGHTRALIVGAPEYWAARGIPAHPHDLDRHTCVLMRNPAGILIDLWEFERDGEKASVKVNGWLCSTGREVVLDSVLAGEGIARLNHLTTRAHLQSGRLLPVLLGLGGPGRSARERAVPTEPTADAAGADLRRVRHRASARHRGRGRKQRGSAALASRRPRPRLFGPDDAASDARPLKALKQRPGAAPLAGFTTILLLPAALPDA